MRIDMRLPYLVFVALVATMAAATSLPFVPAVAARMPLAPQPKTWSVGALLISGAFARSTLPHAPTGGGFITITNKSAADDTLLSVTSPAAGIVQVHAMSMDNGIMKMRAVAGGVAIPAGKTVTFSSAGLHLMFMQLKGAFVQGKTVPVTLSFAKAGAVSIELPVGGIAAKEAPADPVGGMQM
jgi:copper(I)-binding protein